MPDNFEQTVDLSKKLKEKNKRELEKRVVYAKKKFKSKAEGIDEVYDGTMEEEITVDDKFQKINKPKIKKEINPLFKQIFLIILMLLFIFVVFLFIKNNSKKNEEVKQFDYKWYAVKLLNDEIYYGEIGDTSADPVVIRNVYYNYDQINDPKEAKKETGVSNLRLVKRGKETHGPDGTMDVVRDQVVYMEPLRDDSKVLKAILEYEK